MSLGIARVVIGTAALKNPGLVRDVRAPLPAIIVAVDAWDGMVATKGWAEVSGSIMDDMGRRVRRRGCRGVALYRCRAGRDAQGLQCSSDGRSRARGRYPGDRQRRRGGFVADIHVLGHPCLQRGIEGVITGRALYDGRLDLATAIAMAQRS